MTRSWTLRVATTQDAGVSFEAGTASANTGTYRVQAIKRGKNRLIREAELVAPDGSIFEINKIERTGSGFIKSALLTPK